MENFRFIILLIIASGFLYNFLQFNFFNFSLSLIFLLIWVIYIFTIKHQSKKNYQEAIRNSDKFNALAAGRRYYANKRMNILGFGRVNSIFDEQAIQNDLNSRK